MIQNGSSIQDVTSWQLLHFFLFGADQFERTLKFIPWLSLATSVSTGHVCILKVAFSWVTKMAIFLSSHAKNLDGNHFSLKLCTQSTDPILLQPRGPADPALYYNVQDVAAAAAGHQLWWALHVITEHHLVYGAETPDPPGQSKKKTPRYCENTCLNSEVEYQVKLKGNKEVELIENAVKLLK